MNPNCCKGCKKPAGRTSLSSCKRFFGRAVEKAPFGVAAVKDGIVLYSNLACAEILGYDARREVIGTNIIDHVAPEKRSEVVSFIKDIRENGLSVPRDGFFETIVEEKSGSKIQLRIRLTREETRCCELVTLCYVTNVTEQKRKEEGYYNLAIRDHLTGLFNRLYMEETLHREISRARRQGSGMGVVMLDLDHFKMFNDTYGHTAGDELLRAFAQLLNNNVREEDVVCRYGGEEFLIIMPGASHEVVKSRAELIRQETAELKIYFQKNMLSSTTVSIGIAFFPDHGGKEEQIIAVADQALYRAKAEGRDRVVVAE